MRIRMIAFDLDGTALLDDHETITERLQKALDEAYDNDIAVIPVTGRPLSVLPPYISGHPGWERYAILSNGAGIVDLRTGEYLDRVLLGLKETVSILDVAEKHGIAIEYFIEGKLYLTGESYEKEKTLPGLEFHVGHIIPERGIFVDDMMSIAETTPVEKINLIGVKDSDRSAVYDEISKLDVSAVWMRGNDMEVTATQANKGNAVEKLSRMLGIPMSEVMAIGDSCNDISMIASVGLGVAMGNAVAEVKEAARAVTDDNNEDGAAKAIERYVLSSC